ncbi:M48 family metalloprotease [Candidatus Uhrbacteria bacterium]|jgi:heat shock protein HtpX|nr:M48 family metalloprotease [Candidatus Uhrbacteria bacterium]
MYNEIASNKRKTVGLMIIFVLVVLAFGFGFGAYYGDYYAGLAIASIVSIGMTSISFFKSDKIALAASGAKVIKKSDNPMLWNTVENLAITAGLPMPRVAIMNDPALNAFATGRNYDHAVVAVTTGLLDKLTQVELEGVIAHEMSHVKNYDILLMTVVVVLVGTIALLADMMRFGFYGGRGSKKGGNAIAIIALVLVILSPIIGQLIKLAVSRQREYLADASGALLTRYPEGLASALEKISQDSHQFRKANHATAHMFISNPFKGKGIKNAFSTHPPAEKRIERLRNMM